MIARVSGKRVLLGAVCVVGLLQVGARTWPKRALGAAGGGIAKPVAAAPPGVRWDRAPIELGCDIASLGDPFRARESHAASGIDRPAAGALSARASSLTLTGVTLSDVPSAVLNGTVVGVGSVVEGYLVCQITTAGVVVEREGVRVAIGW